MSKSFGWAPLCVCAHQQAIANTVLLQQLSSTDVWNTCDDSVCHPVFSILTIHSLPSVVQSVYSLPLLVKVFAWYFSFHVNIRFTICHQENRELHPCTQQIYLQFLKLKSYQSWRWIPTLPFLWATFCSSSSWWWPASFSCFSLTFTVLNSAFVVIWKQRKTSKRAKMTRKKTRKSNTITDHKRHFYMYSLYFYFQV